MFKTIKFLVIHSVCGNQVFFFTGRALEDFNIDDKSVLGNPPEDQVKIHCQN